MNAALIHNADPEILPQLRAKMEGHGWSVDAYDGMLDMLRLIEQRDYHIVVLNADGLNTEIRVLLGTIEALDKKPKVFLNFSGKIDAIPPTLFALGYPVITGELTGEKFLEAVNNTS